METTSSIEFGKIKKSLEFFGILSENHTPKFMCSRYIFCILFTIFNVSCIFGFINELKTGKLVVICSNMAVLLVGGYASCAVIILNLKTCQKWMSGMFLKEAFFNHHPNKLMRKIHRNNIKHVWPNFMIWVSCWSISVATFVFAAAVLTFVFSRRNNKDVCLENPHCRMIFMGYYHFPGNSNVHYLLANIENIIFGAFNGIMNYNRDLYYSSFICFLRCRILTLTYVVRHLNQFVGEKFETKRFNERVDDVLRQCVKEHQTIILEFENLHKFLSTVFFFMLIVHAAIAVNTAIILLQGELYSSFAIFIYCAVFYGCGHLFSVLWLSEQLSAESSNLADAIYFSPWYKLDVKHQKILLLMMIRSQHPFVLSCGALCKANLGTFMKTMKSVYTTLNAFINVSKRRG